MRCFSEVKPVSSPAIRMARCLCKIISLSLAILLTSCSAGLNQTDASMHVTIAVDGRISSIPVEPGLSVKSALEKAGITLSPLDRVSPDFGTLVISGQEIRVTRVREEFEVVENTLPFERQTVKNETMPEGQTLMIQTGSNGLQQVTYRILFEDNVPVSRNVFKTEELVQARPEIIMIGVQAPFSAIRIPGKIAYLSGGNAWLMDGTSGHRQPLVTTGDLDGRVFALSPKADWLLFSRKRIEDPQDSINSLWVIETGRESSKPISLGIQNVVHHAVWVPDPNLLITYSTVEPRAAAPGWQANNDLHLIYLTARGEISVHKELLEANTGGVYGWWGMNFSWSPFGDKVAFAQPDSVGLIDVEEGSIVPLKTITPLQTRSDWAWVPDITWSRDGVLYTVNHAVSPTTAIAEQSPVFDLTAILPGSGSEVVLAPDAGMFSAAYPSPRSSDNRFLLVYLQAVFPDQSETSRYHLMIMDQDGSNRLRIFPLEGSTGIEPQQIFWSPAPFSDQGYRVALVYQGNLWFVNPQSHQTQQITGDGLITRISWK
jgi:hypothetical protein